MAENLDPKTVEDMELIDGTELKELSSDELEAVAGGTVVDRGTGIFTLKKEAEMYAQAKFRVGFWYKLDNKPVQCYATGAEYKNGRYYSTCYYITQSGATGWATLGKFIRK